MKKRNRNENTEKAGKSALSPAKARVEWWKSIIVNLYLQGHTQVKVAELANEQTGGHRFTRNTVAKYVKEAIEEWKCQKSLLVDNHKAIELAKINLLETTYWNAWQRSCEVVKETSINSPGDAQYLRGVQWCIEIRCKILGIEVPQVAVQVNNNNSTSTTVIRRIVFKTRETSAAPQVINTKNDGQ